MGDILIIHPSNGSQYIPMIFPIQLVSIIMAVPWQYHGDNWDNCPNGWCIPIFRGAWVVPKWYSGSPSPRGLQPGAGHLPRHLAWCSQRNKILSCDDDGDDDDDDDDDDDILEVGTFGVYFVPTSMSKYVLPAGYGVKVVAALLAWCGKKIMLVCQSSFFGISVSKCEKGLRGCLAATTPCGRCCCWPENCSNPFVRSCDFPTNFSGEALAMAANVSTKGINM